MKDDHVQLLGHAFYSRVGPEIVWLELSRKCPKGSLGSSRT